MSWRTRITELWHFFIAVVVLQTAVMGTNLLFWVDTASAAIFHLSQKVLGFRFVKRSKQSFHVPGPKKQCLWLFNHRSWSDFIVDHMLTGHQGSYLSRALVIMAIPLLGTSAAMGGWVWFFKRQAPNYEKKPASASTASSTPSTSTSSSSESSESAKKTPAAIPPHIVAFNNMLDNRFANSAWRGCIAYPEGGRNQKDEHRDLKGGAVRYAYDRGILVQLVLAKNKEDAINEYHMSVKKGVVIPVLYSKPFDPEDYATYAAFFDGIQVKWDKMWGRLYGKSGTPGVDGEGKIKKGEVEFRPAIVPKPGIRRSWTQLRFGLFVITYVSLSLWVIYRYLFA